MLLYQGYLKNYIGSVTNLTSTETLTFYPTNLQELKTIIINNHGKKIRTNANFIGIEDIIINTLKLDQIIELDKDSNEVLVQAGCSIKKICDYLATFSLSLECIPEDIKQTVAEACSTAEHGTNLDTGTMSDQIVDLTAVLSNGQVRRIEFDDPEFPAYATNLGCFGVLYSLTLKCVPTPGVRSARVAGFWNEIKATIFKLLVEYKQSTIHINPYTMRTNLALTQHLKPPAILVTKNNPVQSTIYEPNRDHTKHEIAVPLDQMVDAVDDMLQLCNSYKQSTGSATVREILVTFSGPDHNSWLSPASGRATAWIKIVVDDHNHNHNQILLEDYENLLVYKYSGRPNWNTPHFKNAFKTRVLYKTALDYILRVRERFDPNHTFINDLFD